MLSAMVFTNHSGLNQMSRIPLHWTASRECISGKFSWRLMDSPQPTVTRFLPMQMCTLGRQACTRRVCFFAHTSAELRETVPETLEETAKLRDKLLAEIFINPLYAKTLHQLLAVMSPAQASEVVSVPQQEETYSVQWQILSYCKQSQLPLIHCARLQPSPLQPGWATQMLLRLVKRSYVSTFKSQQSVVCANLTVTICAAYLSRLSSGISTDMDIL